MPENDLTQPTPRQQRLLQAASDLDEATRRMHVTSAEIKAQAAKLEGFTAALREEFALEQMDREASAVEEAVQ